LNGNAVRDEMAIVLDKLTQHQVRQRFSSAQDAIQALQNPGSVTQSPKPKSSATTPSTSKPQSSANSPSQSTAQGNSGGIWSLIWQEITSSASQNDPIPLESDKGVDYRKLRNFLKAGKWKQADYETYLRMLEVVGQKEGNAIELKNFPCKDLKTLDRLWVHYSSGKFGFSIQQEIYVDCGAILDGKYPGNKIWREFCDRVGWRVKNEYIEYREVIFTTSAPQGHLPCRCRSDGYWGRATFRWAFSSLAYRLVKCSK
jgi:hypothetical protein